jgi:hypothetical protein
MRRAALFASLAVVAGAVSAAPWDLSQLMRALASNPGGRASFVETKYIALLDAPVQSSGELTYAPPDRLEKRTQKPKAEYMKLDKDTLSIERGNKKLAINLGDQPEALAFVDSIRRTLAGDRAALERHYALHLVGTAERWTLNLLPNDPRIAALVTSITIAGEGNQVRRIEYRQADGDRAVMSVAPLDGR